MRCLGKGSSLALASAGMGALDPQPSFQPPLSFVLQLVHAAGKALQDMLSPSQGFCFCLPVRLGSLVVSILAFLGSGILAGVTFRSLAILSAHITSIQTAGFYLTLVSWTTLALFCLLGFISVLLESPLLLTIFARFVIYHIHANAICNIFFTIILFRSYRDAEAVLRSPECGRSSAGTSLCGASAALQTLTWIYLFIILPVFIAQAYVYIITRRYIFVISGEWEAARDQALETRRRSMGKLPDRRRTMTQTIGHGGRRAKAHLWFTMETPSLEADESFLPSMILTPIAFQSPPRTPFSMASGTRPRSPFLLRSPRLGNKTSLHPSLPSSPAMLLKDKDGASDRSARLGMDFSDPEPATLSTHSAEWLNYGPPSSQGAHEGSLRSASQGRPNSDASVYSMDSVQVVVTPPIDGGKQDEH